MKAIKDEDATKVYRVVGNSMFPHVHPGDVVVCRVEVGPLRWGDIGVFKFDGKLVVHRVVMPGRHMGDHERKIRPFQHQEVVGRVVALQRGTTRLDLEKATSRARGRVLAISGLSRLAARRLAGSGATIHDRFRRARPPERRRAAA